MNRKGKPQAAYPNNN